jgi:hypothetical protein
MNEKKARFLKILKYLPAFCIVSFLIVVMGEEIISVIVNSGKNNDKIITEKVNETELIKPIKEPIDSVALKQKQEKDKAEILKNKKRIEIAKRKMRIKYDDVQDITWYYYKSTPIRNNNKNIHIYFGKVKDKIPYLRLKITYSASKWLFIESYDIKTDDDTYNIQASFNEVERDNDYNGIWEWYDTTVDDKTIDIINSIISSKNSKIRYHGRQYIFDRIISNSEKNAMKNSLDAYYTYSNDINNWHIFSLFSISFLINYTF